MLLNLLHNAYKYGGPEPRITVRGRPEKRGLRIDVEDHGEGISRLDQRRIFERFYRVDPNGVKPGMGLGLSIVRGLVESCGGTVWVEDAPGGGAAFRVSLRAGTTADQRAEVAHV